MAYALSIELEQFIQQQLKSGQYHTAEEVLAEALALLLERQHLRALRRERLVGELADGIFQADNRQLVDAAELFHGLHAQAESTEE